jgi:putative endonuclease
MLARFMFAWVDFAARKGLSEASAQPEDQQPVDGAARKLRAQRTGVHGETYAYWYLRRHGYIVVARNYRRPGIKGEIDMVAYDGRVLAFVEVKTRTANASSSDRSIETTKVAPEFAVNAEKRRNLLRVADQFLREWRIGDDPYRFDILAIESCAGSRPEVRLHKGAFSSDAV